MKKLIDKINNVKFESVINGYSPIIVDIFLDSIVEDIKNIEIQMNELKNTNDELKNKIKEMEQEYEKLLDKSKQDNFISLPKNNINDIDTKNENKEEK